MSNDGGQAFPRPNVPGMTLRDWYAGQALAGLMANSNANIEWMGKHAVVSAYSAADAMLIARERRK